MPLAALHHICAVTGQRLLAAIMQLCGAEGSQPPVDSGRPELWDWPIGQRSMARISLPQTTRIAKTPVRRPPSAAPEPAKEHVYDCGCYHCTYHASRMTYPRCQQAVRL